MLIRNKKTMNSKFRITTTVPESFLPDEKEHFRLSRYALRHLCGQEDLTIEKHLHLKSAPNIKVSISHTDGAAAAMICESESTISIGIDIEWSCRQVKPGIEKFFINEADDCQINKLENWCIKEAAYKAYSPIYNDEKVLVLKDFTIKDNAFYICDKYIGDYEVEYQEIDGREIIITKAHICKS